MKSTLKTQIWKKLLNKYGKSEKMKKEYGN